MFWTGSVYGENIQDIFTRPDKGSGIIVLHYSDYVAKMSYIRWE